MLRFASRLGRKAYKVNNLSSKSSSLNTRFLVPSPFVRAMSSESEKYQFVVFAPDKADAFSNRLSVREKHLQNAKELHDSGIIS